MKKFKLVLTLFSMLLFLNCVQKAQPKTITVMVDMNAIEKPTKVGIRGNNPLSWEETTYLSDENGDGIYEDTFEIYTANYDIEFKFINNNSEFELQDQSNRSITFEYKPEIIIYKAVFNNSKNIQLIKK